MAFVNFDFEKMTASLGLRQYATRVNYIDLDLQSVTQILIMKIIHIGLLQKLCKQPP